MVAPNRPGACGSRRGRSKAIRRVPSAKASLMSCVTMITVMPRSRQSGLISACIWARVPGSSAPNGSSSSSTRGFARQRLGDGEALLHAAGERARILVAMRVQSHRRRAALRFPRWPHAAPGRAGAPRMGLAANSKADQHVAKHSQVREHRIALEHDAAVGPRLVRQRRAVEEDVAARRPLLSEDQPQERALAASRGADHRDEGAGRDLEIDALEHDLVAVFDPHVAARRSRSSAPLARLVSPGKARRATAAQARNP